MCQRAIVHRSQYSLGVVVVDVDDVTVVIVPTVMVVVLVVEV